MDEDGAGVEIVFEPLDEFERFAEERRIDANKLLWQVPGLSLTAQSFLVGAATSANVSPWLRIAVALLAAILAVSTLQLLARHRYRTRLFANGLDASREARGLPPLDVPDYFEHIARHRPGPEGEAFRAYMGNRWYGHHWPAWNTWLCALLAFLLLDLIVIGFAIEMLWG